jgi:hypothetical protein
LDQPTSYAVDNDFDWTPRSCYQRDHIHVGEEMCPRCDSSGDRSLPCHPLGLGSRGWSVMWVLIPIMVELLARQIYLFHKKLGKTVSESVSDELQSKFQNFNEKAADTIFNEAFKGRAD